MGGLAMMAWWLAWQRAYGLPSETGSMSPDQVVPWSRSDPLPLAEKEYYRIIDRLSRGEAP